MWLQVDVSGSKLIDEIDVFGIQDNPGSPTEPTPRFSVTKYMESINTHHAAHIGRVKADFYLSARDLDPDVVSRRTGLKPYRTAKRFDERRNYTGGLVSPHDEGFWMISSADRVESKDLNDHLQSLLEVLLPYRRVLLQIAADLKGETFFDVLWTSSYLYAGTGPIISCEVLRAMSDLGASIGFDIYQEDDDS